ncbi:MAG: hypothetical protein R3190_08885 [Thermoanaerobaculia bacterium]|nr:hypothetical protein [Thermoanaerobaculia bacterium]
MTSRNQLLVRPWAVGVLLALALFSVACGPSEEEVRAAARAEEWAELQADHEALTALRQEMRGLLAAPAPPVEGEDGEPAEEGEPAENPRIAELRSEITAKADAFAERLVNFINDNAGFEGEEPHPEVKGAIRLKSGEDIVLAQEYVDKGGDWAKAIEIISSAMIVDPDNPELAARLEEAERMRYMDEERWAAVEKGMTEDEVRAALGQVKHQNVRKYDDRGVTAWFYPKEGGAAAAVFFRENKGVLKVYDLNFDAVKTAEERAEEG